LGLTRGATVHGQTLVYAMSSEFSKVENKTNYGFGVNAWCTNVIYNLLSFGMATVYYTDFSRQKAMSLRPMVGLGYRGIQLVYEYDIMVLQPNYAYGNHHMLALRVNLWLLDLED
jgi:hypothetical protein